MCEIKVPFIDAVRRERRKRRRRRRRRDVSLGRRSPHRPFDDVGVLGVEVEVTVERHRLALVQPRLSVEAAPAVGGETDAGHRR